MVILYEKHDKELAKSYTPIALLNHSLEFTTKIINNRQVAPKRKITRCNEIDVENGVQQRDVLSSSLVIIDLNTPFRRLPDKDIETSPLTLSHMLTIEQMSPAQPKMHSAN